MDTITFFGCTATFRGVDFHQHSCLLHIVVNNPIFIVCDFLKWVVLLHLNKESQMKLMSIHFFFPFKSCSNQTLYHSKPYNTYMENVDYFCNGLCHVTWIILNQYFNLVINNYRPAECFLVIQFKISTYEPSKTLNSTPMAPIP